MKGRMVSLKDALDGCERILQDEFKDIPEVALYMIGTADEAYAKAANSNITAPQSATSTQ
jgi:F-type H+-transporting ATPase subunit beta